MRPVGCPLPPSSSLPSLRALRDLDEASILTALQGLSDLYCPLPASLALGLDAQTKSDVAATDLVDSGYTSGTEDNQADANGDKHTLLALRADAFERSVAERWLTGFIARAEELPGLSCDETRQEALDQASYILESFYANNVQADEADDDDTDFAREFSFDMSQQVVQHGEPKVHVRLNDGLAGTNSSDFEDVGLQSWGASIVFSKLICADPARFSLTQQALGPSPRIIELGAGTGLVSLVLGAMLPCIQVPTPTVIATDYHPAVLANLRTNIDTNFSSKPDAPVQASLLDWSTPSTEPPFHLPADMLIATDVVYAPQHAAWLIDCATRLLSPTGIFWLLITVRSNGKFEGISKTVESAFAVRDRLCGSDGRRLEILESADLEKSKGVGRGDESGYRLFRIGWA